jgi:hypothetical protein
MVAAGVGLILGAVTMAAAIAAAIYARRAAVATENTVTLAQETAEAGFEANKIAREGMISGQRAYLEFDTCKAHLFRIATPDGSVEEIVEVWLPIINAGNTFARNFIGQYATRVCEPQTLPVIPFHVPITGCPDPPSVFGRSGSRIFQFHFDKATLMQVYRGEVRILIYCRLEYEDAFENTPARHTQTCVEVLVRGSPENAWDEPTPAGLFVFKNYSPLESYG